MTTSIYVNVKDLPNSIQIALNSVNYMRGDIQVLVKETESVQVSGGKGYRGFCILVHIPSGRTQIHWGSWGGENIFNPQNQVDRNSEPYIIPVDGCVIKGSIGGDKPVYATISISPSNVILALPGKSELTDRQREILGIFKSYKPSYRKEELHRKMVAETEILELVEKSYLKKDGRGISITTAGKNEAAKVW